MTPSQWGRNPQRDLAHIRVVDGLPRQRRWKYGDGIARSATAIQTEARVNPGSSGGPLLDEAGAIVGIVVGSAAAAEGVY